MNSLNTILAVLILSILSIKLSRFLVSKEESDRRLACAVESIADGRSNMAFVFICRKMPPTGTLDWDTWLLEKGECELAVKKVRDP